MTLPTVHELLDELAHSPGDEYVYRGQARSFPTLLPSAFRAWADPIDDDPNAFAISRGRVIAQRTRRQEEQARLRAFWIGQFGLSLGGLLAQQYLAQSEVIDVTTDPRVAAFFATHRGTSCRHIDGDAEPGMLLRWRTSVPGRSLEELRRDLTLGALHPLNASSSAQPIPTKYTVASPRTPEYIQVRDEPNAFLMLRHEFFTLTDIQTVLAAAVERERGAIYRHHWMFEYFPTSRWVAQAGALLRPTLRFPARVTIDGRTLQRALDQETGIELPSNMKVVVAMPDRVVDAYTIGPVECFPFRHTSEAIDLDPETLWPSPDRDLIFLNASLLAWTSHGDYFEEARTNFPWDPQSGLVDRGFYPEGVTEEYRQQEWRLFAELRNSPPSRLRHPPGVRGRD